MDGLFAAGSRSYNVSENRAVQPACYDISRYKRVGEVRRGMRVLFKGNKLKELELLFTSKFYSLDLII